MKVKPNTWYAVVLTEPLGVMPAKAKAWLKLNTEKPLKLGPTYWVYQPKAKQVMHVVEDLLDSQVRLGRNAGQPIIADAQQTKVLNSAFLPLVTNIIKGWARQGRVSQRLGLVTSALR